MSRPRSMPEGSVLRRIWVKITDNYFQAKFTNGAGVGLRRDNPKYYRVVGEWFCREMDALNEEDKGFE